MEDFSLIDVNIDFLDGPYVHIPDEKNDSYALEFYEKFRDLMSTQNNKFDFTLQNIYTC